MHERVFVFGDRGERDSGDGGVSETLDRPERILDQMMVVVDRET